MTPEAIAAEALRFIPTADPGDEPWHSRELAAHYEQALKEIANQSK